MFIAHTKPNGRRPNWFRTNAGWSRSGAFFFVWNGATQRIGDVIGFFLETPLQTGHSIGLWSNLER